mmetsp:Transcript_30126/g.64161  ORF Transcript_30126/g.64161 Transcript_30126/m.64161 type:complete len:510 (-) Transcript_30126:48-1577(-)
MREDGQPILSVSSIGSALGDTEMEEEETPIGLRARPNGKTKATLQEGMPAISRDANEAFRGAEANSLDGCRPRSNTGDSNGAMSSASSDPIEEHGTSSNDPHLYDSFDESSSEMAARSLGKAGAPLLRLRRRTGQNLQQRAQRLVVEMRRRQEMFKSRQQTLAQSVGGELRHQWLSQQEKLVRRSKEMTRRLRTGRSRAWRHKWVFALVQADFVAAAFWLGRSPETYYLYFTVQILCVLACKFVDYWVSAQHYFLWDFCFFANYCVLAWLWLLPTSGWAFNAAEGVCGLLTISVVVFRNSCVPHDFVRISNAYVHYPAVVMVLSTKMSCQGDHCIGMQAGQALPWMSRIKEAWLAYMLWAVIYATIIFLVARNRIDRKQRDTLYKYFSIQLGYKEKLPKWLRPYAQVVFMAGHQTLFLSGIWWLLFPFWLQALTLVWALVVFFHNGGRFYVDHFWKAYERNTAQYVDAVQLAMSQADATPVEAQSKAQKVADKENIEPQASANKLGDEE